MTDKEWDEWAEAVDNCEDCQALLGEEQRLTFPTEKKYYCSEHNPREWERMLS